MSRLYGLLALTLICVLAAVLLPAMAQPQAYHDFADHRSWLGIANAFDVASNIGFLLAGVTGLVVTARPRTVFAVDAERWPYAIFFLGMLLTAFGSGYYHLAPDNERLFWDRLPMTVAFMALIATQIVDRISRRAGLLLLIPMLITGAMSVWYWRMTEQAGAGNVMPYAILQAYSVVALLLIALMFRSRYTHSAALYWVFAWYVLAKFLELLDTQIFALGNLCSGHTLKHLAAGAAGLVLCRMLLLRQLQPVNT